MTVTNENRPRGAQPSKSGETLRSYISRNRSWVGTGVVFLTMMAIFLVSSPEVFGTWVTHKSVMVSLPVLVFLTLPLVFIIAVGEIDLSFPSTMGIASGLFALMVSLDYAPLLAVARHRLSLRRRHAGMGRHRLGVRRLHRGAHHLLRPDRDHRVGLQRLPREFLLRTDHHPVAARAPMEPDQISLAGEVIRQDCFWQVWVADGVQEAAVRTRAHRYRTVECQRTNVDLVRPADGRQQNGLTGPGFSVSGEWGSGTDWAENVNACLHPGHSGTTLNFELPLPFSFSGLGASCPVAPWAVSLSERASSDLSSLA